jgi:hypothetical protein
MTSVLIAEQRRAFVANYNRSSFAFQHALHELDIFDTSELAAMSERLPDPAYCSTADSAIVDGWKRVGQRGATLARTLETMLDTNSLVLLKHCERDQVHGATFRRIMDDVVDQAGTELRGDIEAGRATLVISSPQRVTPYHIDGEANFLLQVRGSKLLYAFDPNDRGILPDPELEAFYGGDMDAARYREERQGDARTFALAPGIGIHLPLHTPHWAQNLADVSVGLSLNFTLRSGARLAGLYKMNHRLRKAGLRPAPPGASAWGDRLKLAAFAGMSFARPLLRREH